jgi:hypothetical protein
MMPHAGRINLEQYCAPPRGATRQPSGQTIEFYRIDDSLEIFVLFALTLDPSGRGKCMPFSLREKGWDEGMFGSNCVRLNRMAIREDDRTGSPQVLDRFTTPWNPAANKGERK